MAKVPKSLGLVLIMTIDPYCDEMHQQKSLKPSRQQKPQGVPPKLTPISQFKTQKSKIFKN